MNRFEWVDEGMNVLESVLVAVREADHLRPSDAGAVANAVAFARQIQSKIDAGEAEKLMYGPFTSLNNALNDLGLTARGRAALNLDDEQEDEDEF